MVGIVLALSVLALFSLVGVLAVTPEKAARRAVAFTVLWVTLLPLNGAHPVAIGIGVMTISVMNSVALSKVGLPREHRHLFGIAIALLAWMQLRQILTEGFGPLSFGVSIAMVTTMLVAARLSKEDLQRLGVPLAWVFVAHGVWALLEVFAGVPGIWAMSDGTNDITLRVNEVFPQLPGRPMSSFSHPIPFAAFLLLSLAFFIYLWHSTRKSGYFFLATAAMGMIALTGTRSAVLSAVLLLLAFMVMTLNFRRVYSYFLLGSVAGIGIMAAGGVSGLLGWLGLGGDFLRSGSYLHRSMVVDSFPTLFSRDLTHVLFGWGTDVHWIFDNQIVPRYSDEFYFFDNQFVAMMVSYGLTGLILFITALFAVLLRGRLLARLLLTVFVVMSFSFDTMTHFIGMTIFVLAAGIAGAGKLDHSERVDRLEQTHESPLEPAR